MSEERLISPEAGTGEQDSSLRPQTLGDFIGQAAVRENLKVFIEAAKSRQEAMDHVLFYGPPGLGKTTLAQIVSRELGVGFRATSGPVIAKAGDLAAVLTNLEERDVLFIDEIHRLNPAIEEVLYPAMEDFQLDLIIGEGPAARSVRIVYTPDELELIVARGARVLGFDLTSDGAAEIARRARGTPRVAGRLLRRVRDFALVAGHGAVTATMADAALRRLEVDHLGLDSMDRRYMSLIIDNYGGGPVGVETLAAALSEARDTLEEVVEPYLLQQGLIQRTPRGRMVSSMGFKHLGLTPPKTVMAQLDLLDLDEDPE
jgi:Holliday junction DNA helicase RuvB